MTNIKNIKKANYVKNSSLIEMCLEYTNVRGDYSNSNGAENSYDFFINSTYEKKEKKPAFPGISPFNMSHLLIAPNLGQPTWGSKARVELTQATMEKTVDGRKYSLKAIFSGKRSDRINHPLLVIGNRYAIHWNVGQNDNDGFFYPYARVEKIRPIPSTRKIIPLDPNLNSLLCLGGSLDYEIPGQVFIYGPNGISFLCEMEWATDIEFKNDSSNYKIFASRGNSKTDITDIVRERSLGEFNERVHEPLDKIVERTIIVPFSRF